MSGKKLKLYKVTVEFDCMVGATCQKEALDRAEILEAIQNDSFALEIEATRVREPKDICDGYELCTQPYGTEVDDETIGEILGVPDAD